MKTIKVSEASGVVLDYLVSKSDNPPGRCGWGWFERDAQGFLFDPLNEVRYSPSTDWAQGGPVVERENITTRKEEGQDWEAYKIKEVYLQDYYFTNKNPLIAAMRCYVASKLGDVVQVPKELT